MPEEFRSRSLLKDVLRLAIEVDGLLDDGAFRMDKALLLRQQLYDLIKHLEKIPLAPTTEGLFQIAARAFTSVQQRLTNSGS